MLDIETIKGVVGTVPLTNFCELPRVHLGPARTPMR